MGRSVQRRRFAGEERQTWVVPYKGFSAEGTIGDCSEMVDLGMGGNLK